MQIAKYEHSCLVITEQGQILIIDPGQVTTSLPDLSNVAALIITHEHFDHLDKDKVQKIIAANPSIKIYSTAEVASQLAPQPVEIVKTNFSYTVGAFSLEFFGEFHAPASPDFPPAQNVGVLVNNKMYTPGDSFIDAPKPYEVLTIPIMAPWLKYGESLKMVKASPAKTILAIHDGLINEIGNQVYERWFTPACKALGKNYQVLKPGGSLSV